ncbi:MAG: hypothetical protein KKA65_02180 [Nanoarchaeota archaeon]|nr:hypothetical protein [Nanoarchaeota archaeon]MBU4242325.1 hypothetical protein [Nanoarchaeota archaeon]MBU4351490.1 hypothetical protein [Nanoarchaeota archaeon]MBU4456284.1 hypothetical protein [Nanoarchaeota archaeon]MCG2720134.1 hypothetical protein [Nanoarchaeota archaeon]
MKRGQITVFIVLGLIFVAVIGLLIAYKDTLMGSQTAQVEGIGTLQPELMGAGELIEDCIKEVAKSGLSDLGMHAGIIDNSQLETFDFSGLDATYLYSNSESKLPSREAMEESLALFVKQNVRDCLAVELPGFEVTPAEVKEVSADIGSEEVDVAVEWPITIKKAALESKVDGFKISVPVRLGIIYNEVESFISQQLETPEEVCLSCLLDSAQEKDLSIEVNNFISTYVFVVKDTKVLINDQPYHFVFANGY